MLKFPSPTMPVLTRQDKTDVNCTLKFHFCRVSFSSCCSSCVLLAFPRLNWTGSISPVDVSYTKCRRGVYFRIKGDFPCTRPDSDKGVFPYHLAPVPPGFCYVTQLWLQQSSVKSSTPASYWRFHCV